MIEHRRERERSDWRERERREDAPPQREGDQSQAWINQQCEASQ